MEGFKQDFGLSGLSHAQVTDITCSSIISPRVSHTFLSNYPSAHVVSILLGGCFFGALLGAPLSEWIGRRRALLVCMAIVGPSEVLTYRPQVVSVIFLIGAAGTSAPIRFDASR